SSLAGERELLNYRTELIFPLMIRAIANREYSYFSYVHLGFHAWSYYDDLVEDFRAVGRGLEACFLAYTLKPCDPPKENYINIYLIIQFARQAVRSVTL
ncbi:hypothetical protein L9F63_015113, partial [Diploptera punctata]